jgi:HAD domain in Swiss Army Knife RNA repair proteins
MGHALGHAGLVGRCERRELNPEERFRSPEPESGFGVRYTRKFSENPAKNPRSEKPRKGAEGHAWGHAGHAMRGVKEKLNAPRRVIFLDLDGVANSTAWFRRRGPRPPGRDPLVHNIDPLAIKRLNRLWEATRAVVVMSSTWRLWYSVRSLNEHLRGMGLAARVVGRTPDMTGKTIPMPELSPTITRGARRGDEILDWLQKHPPVFSFVILDDEDDMGVLRDRLVQTSFDEGLTDAHVERATALLSVQAEGWSVDPETAQLVGPEPEAEQGTDDERAGRVVEFKEHVCPIDSEAPTRNANRSVVEGGAAITTPSTPSLAGRSVTASPSADEPTDPRACSVCGRMPTMMDRLGECAGCGATLFERLHGRSG